MILARRVLNAEFLRRFDNAHAALGALLGLNGLRVSEASATNTDGLGFD
jgi:hypothetical protein